MMVMIIIVNEDGGDVGVEGVNDDGDANEDDKDGNGTSDGDSDGTNDGGDDYNSQ